MPATLLCLAGKFSPPTIAVQYQNQRGVRKVYEMPLPRTASELTAAEIAEELRLAHAPLFAALAIPENKLHSTIDRVVEGYERKQLEAIELERQLLEARLAEVQSLCQTASSCGSALLDGDEDDDDDLLRKSVRSALSSASKGSSHRRANNRYAAPDWSRVDASAESDFEWARCLDEEA
jgi:hypothetical protein